MDALSNQSSTAKKKMTRLETLTLSSKTKIRSSRGNKKKIYDKKMQDKDEEIDGVTHKPRLNDISMAITENMESRDEPTHFRLYRKGAIKLRDINEKDL